MKDPDRSEEALFEKCLELPPREWEAFLRETCGEDDALRKSVLELLTFHQTSEAGFLEELPEEDSALVADQLNRIAPSDESPGDQIGRYRLLELIGEGAWGSVWMAQQTQDINRRVALKILKLGLDTKDFLARFEAERQMLAMMDHPNIAKVLDAGATDHGRPYLVMELVKGMPLLEYADKKRLSLADRVSLFVKICCALQHAHQKGIIHRDLKPSNILVSVQDDETAPKVIDFGVAKTNQFRLTDKTLFTSIHTYIGTPVYSSPEQLEFTGMDVDPRSDVYSLGALLYEFLCGKTPFDYDKTRKEGMTAFRTLVQEKVPPTPSQRFARLEDEEEQAQIASKRRCTVHKVQSRLKGDLDWIIMKCLEKEPSRRYETTQTLAQDLQAYLDGAAVTAAAPSLLYHIRKFITRKRPTYALWAEVPLVVFAVLSLAALFWLRAPGPPEKSIAVLPLTNMSPDPANAFFADGVQEDILTNLSRVRELQVIARTSTQQYRDTDKTMQTIGKELGVNYLLEGSVRRNADRIKITVQLIDCKTGDHLWANDYLRDLSDTFTIQSEVAKAIAGHLEVVLSPEEIAQIDRRPTENQEAYDLFVKFRSAHNNLQLTNAERIALLEQVVSLDPHFAEAWAHLAIATSFRWWVVKHRDDPALIERARYAMKQAEHLGEGLEYVPFARSTLIYNETGDLEAAIIYNLEAISIAPHFTPALRNLGRQYHSLGRLSEAEHYLKIAARLDPLSLDYNGLLFRIYHLQRKWEEAENLVEENLQRNPGEPYWLRMRAVLDYSKTRDREAFIEALERNPNFALNDPIHRISSALAARDFEEALKWSEQIEDPRFLFGFLGWGGFTLQSRDLGIALIWFQLEHKKNWQEYALKAQAYLEEITQKDPLPNPARFACLAVCHALLGDGENMQAFIVKARDQSRKRRTMVSPPSSTEITIAVAYLVHGEVDRALKTLEDLDQSANPVMLNRVLDLWFIFDQLRGNPRFEALL